MSQRNNQTRDPKDLLVNAVLEEVEEPWSEESYSRFKYSISQDGVKIPIEIAEIDGIDNTVVEGHHRFRAVKELLTEGRNIAGKIYYDIPVHDNGVMQLVEAKLLAWKLNHLRGQKTAYQDITSACRAFPDKTAKEISNIFGDNVKGYTLKNVNEVREFNNKVSELKLTHVAVPESVVLSVKGIQNGTLSNYSEILKELHTVEKVQTAIAAIDNDQFRATISDQFKDYKPTRDADKTIAEINIALDKLEHPQKYLDRKQQTAKAYLTDFQKLHDKVLKWSKGIYPEDIFTFKIGTEAKLREDYDYGLQHYKELEAVRRLAKEPDTEVYCIMFFKIPKGANV